MPDDGRPGPRSGLALGWWAVVAVSLLVLVFGDAPERTRLWSAVFDAGHVPLFGLVALAVRALLAARMRAVTDARRAWLAFAVTVACGAATEFVQTAQSNREPSLADLLRDAAGAGAFLLLAVSRAPRASGPVPAAGALGGRRAVLAAFALLTLSLAHLGTTAAAYIERGRAVPTLFALDGSWWERRFVDERDSTLVPHSRPDGLDGAFGESLARLELRPGVYPGLALDEPYPDWSAYRSLVFTVVSDLEAPIQLAVRVHDAAHDKRYADRFTRALTVLPGVNRFVIPIDEIRRAPDRREMDMHRIRGVILFAHQLKAPTRVYLGAFRLE